MNLNEVRDLVDKAMADLALRGVEHAWEKLEGDNLVVLKWADIRAVLESVEGLSVAIDPTPNPDSGRANGFLHDDSEGNPL